MKDPLLPWSTFNTVITVLIALGCLWAAVDILHLTRLRGKSLKDPANRDKLFGYIIGITVATFTTVGILRFHGVV